MTHPYKVILPEEVEAADSIEVLGYVSSRVVSRAYFGMAGGNTWKESKATVAVTRVVGEDIE